MPVNFPIKHKQSAPPSEKKKDKQSTPSTEKKKDIQSATPPAHSKAKQSEPPPAQIRTLPDVVPDDTSTKDKVGWKLFREKFLLKKAAGSAWTSSIRIPTSDVNDQGNRSQRRDISFVDANHTDDGGERVRAGKSRPQLARRTSVRFENHDPADDTVKPQNVPCDDDNNDEDDPLSEGHLIRKERSLSAREAVASQEAAEAIAKQEETENNGSSEGEEPVKMSLMDLLGDEYEDDEEEEEEEEEGEEEEEIVQSKGIEFTCSICNVNISSSAYMPCAHTFCRLCSKELSVQRGSCPLCTAYVSEILHIF
ncbi:hypothetical protein F3Y22_tig00111812pilonHSYRG00186 [Hibiscus syriacus]|uniref:RING-type domain-containing protein n=1 Tax=Hibiscus syriacus TaxID=106335 RepID=A0A6A2XZV8_HIBSY|nr:hypothetical protein F3Y22_tig00111812pilonHSYRG00186 [Hibiscus syriacus]